jgi:hypothetical protein
MKFGNGIDLDNQRIVNVADPSSATDAVNKQYADALTRNLSWKLAVRAASTANMAVASAVINGASMDGVSLVTGDRVLLKNQTTASENGIYVVAASGAASRATDADSAAELKGATVTVLEGTVAGDKIYRLITDNVTLGTDSLVWTEVGGGGTTYSADGDGIQESGGVFSLELDSATLSKSASGLRVNSAIAGAGIVFNSSALDVNVGTGLEISSDAVRIAASAAGAGLTGGGASALAVGAGTGITVNADDVALSASVAGAGLTHTSGVLDVVGASGGGITVNANDIAVNSSVARVYAANIGDGSTTNIVVTHSLGTRDVQVTVRNASAPYEEILVDNEATSTTTCTVKFAVAPSTNQYRVIVQGVGA